METKEKEAHCLTLSCIPGSVYPVVSPFCFVLDYPTDLVFFVLKQLSKFPIPKEGFASAVCMSFQRELVSFPPPISHNYYGIMGDCNSQSSLYTVRSACVQDPNQLHITEVSNFRYRGSTVVLLATKP